MEMIETRENIYESLPALETYLADVRARREQRRLTRKERERLETAIALAAAERAAAFTDEDAEIVSELDAVLAEFQRRLDRLKIALPAAVSLPALPLPAPVVLETTPVVHAVVSARLPETETLPVVPPPAVMEAPAPPNAALNGKSHRAGDPLDIAAAQEDTRIEAARTQAETQAVLETVPETVPEAATESLAPAIAAVPARTQAETRAISERLWARMETLEAQWRELDALGLESGGLNRPACFRARALSCRLNELCAEAEDTGLDDALHPAARALRDRIQMARHYAGDSENVLPFDALCAASAEVFLTAADWSDLAAQYERAAQSQEAWNWYAAQDPGLVAGAARNLLNSIGAGQQMLFRALDHYEASDRLQKELYGKLREAVAKVGFLDALAPETKWHTLESEANELASRRRYTEQCISITLEKREKDKRRHAAIEAVVAWGQGRDRSDTSEAAIERERAALLPLLDACLEAGVPASNPQTRAALLDCAPRLLAGLPRYAKILEAVCAERQRRLLDAPPCPPDNGVDEEDLPDSQIESTLEMTRTFAQDLKITIIGGTSKPQVAEKLKALLACREVVWPDSKKSDRAAKFETDLRDADIVVAVKKYASHEMTEKSREWAKEEAHHHVLLPSGYGPNQIVNQIYLRLVKPKTAAKATAAKAPGLNTRIGMDILTLAKAR